MSKSKKKNSQKQVLLSPENYIRQKARNLPITECFITPDWEKCGECNILVVRKHTNNNYTIGIYLIDTYCLGVKNSGYCFNIDEDEYEDLKNRFPGKCEPISYSEIHNIIYGALEYAEDLGFRPHKDFNVAQYILEEDTDDVPLIEYEFGCNGKPMLIVNSQAEANRYLPTLKKAVGDDFDLLVREADDEDFDDFEYDDEGEEKRLNEELFDDMTEEEKKDFLTRLEEMKKRLEKNQSLPRTEYNYQYPEYPQNLELTHKELEALFDPKNNDKLDKTTLDTLLALPRETLIKDLENCVLFEIGRNCREISEKNNDENIYGSITHALNLLAELKATESLQVVLEVMRQSEEFSEFFFGDSIDDILVPVLYQLAKNQLPALFAYFKEPNLNPYRKATVSTVFEAVLHYEPERRAEIIALYDDVFDFLFENINDTAYYDANLAGMIMHEPMNFEAKELLPKIKRLFDTGLVDEMPCGDYEQVEKEINDRSFNFPFGYEVKSVYEIYG